jgi:hypothetical protein
VDSYGNEYKKPSNPPAECYVPDKLISIDEIQDVAADLGEKWQESELQTLMDRADKNQDGVISEDEFLFFMGKKYLDGLPRDSYVREPWERTRRSTRMQEALYKCSQHHGTAACIGGDSV